ncbi:hypothetical protein AUK40_05705 [Candidatus Wirthbacteria bacterium CG2_30_54_11]|uniref:Uncharacterized protein n=1 Tax=Candidatus Wirthbacteria bacterium CG2_30_54_11 TaxID=1817892 RepID=A0A1J5IU27_9BACT|nr:MAG: hypothetical protein AUK40_05705 [Candidatus Wirthbacteria bacterium CG2_30_54_11]
MSDSQVSQNEMAERGTREQVLFVREKIPPFERGFEQIKFVFMKLQEWLLTKKQEALAEMMEMLDRLRHLYPRAYQHLLHLITMALREQGISVPLGQPPPAAIPVPLTVTP